MALVDVVTGKDAAVAILAALVARGRGPVPAERRRLHASLAASAAAALVNVAQNVLVSGRDAARWGNAHPNLVPYQLFDAADRPIVVAVGSDPQWQACARALGLPELADDSRLSTNAGRLAHRAVVGDASPLTGVAPSVPGSAVRRAPPRLDAHGALVRARGWDAFAGSDTKTAP